MMMIAYEMREHLVGTGSNPLHWFRNKLHELSESSIYQPGQADFKGLVVRGHMKNFEGTRSST